MKNERLNEIAKIEDGWLDGEGAAILPEVLEKCDEFLDRTSSCLVDYGVYPMEEGGVSVEFEHDGWDYGVDFEDDGQFWFYGVEIDGRDDVEKVFSSCQFDDLVKFVVGLFEDGEATRGTI